MNYIFIIITVITIRKTYFADTHSGELFITKMLQNYVACNPLLLYFQGNILLPLLCAYSWNEWLTLPIKYNDLPRNAQLAFTIWDIYGPNQTTPVGGTTISVFGKQG